MRIFVTGGTGFIGSHFMKLALEAGHHLVALRRPGSAPVIQLPKEPEWLHAPLDDVPEEHFSRCDALVHFAAQGVSPQPTSWGQAFDINVRQSLELFERAAKSGVPHLIACGSCFEFGRSGERYDFIPPDAPLEPIGPYAASKAAFSLSIQAMARSTAAAFTILRPFHVFGEGQHSDNFWPSLRHAAIEGVDFPMSPGEQLRDYLPVEDTAAAFLERALSQPKPGFTQKNLGSGTPVSLQEFAAKWWQVWGASGRLLPGELAYRRNEVMRFVPLIEIKHS
jgi:nucleoside-diphosphate-sugar epimerase